MVNFNKALCSFVLSDFFSAFIKFGVGRLYLIDFYQRTGALYHINYYYQIPVTAIISPATKLSSSSSSPSHSYKVSTLEGRILFLFIFDISSRISLPFSFAESLFWTEFYRLWRSIPVWVNKLNSNYSRGFDNELHFCEYYDANNLWNWSFYKKFGLISVEALNRIIHYRDLTTR